ncbi:MAG TPA: hypothetical protein VIS74_00090 [Chthoniobacterales bacterium]
MDAANAQAWPTTQKERLEINRMEREREKAEKKAQQEREKKRAEAAAKPKPAPTPEEMPSVWDVIEVASPDPLNPKVPFYIRPPAGYRASELNQMHRVLVLLTFYQESGIKVLKRSAEYQQIADERGWFMIAPTFRMNRDDARNRAKSYYYPETWSGKAVLQALDEIAKRYPVDGHRLFVSGLSGGAQFAHRFALWAADRVEAAAVNSCGWFDEPGPSARKVAWVITVGESDPILPESLDFTEKLRAQGATPVLRTYLGMLHEDAPRVNAFCGRFLAERDDATREFLGKSVEEPAGWKYNVPASHPFVGDRRDGIYYANGSGTLEVIPEQSRIFLPSGAMAELWGQSAE